MKENYRTSQDNRYLLNDRSTKKIKEKKTKKTERKLQDLEDGVSRTDIYVVPGKITSAEWKKLQHDEDSYLYCMEILDEVVKNVLKRCLNSFLASRGISYVVEDCLFSTLKYFKWQNLRKENNIPSILVQKANCISKIQANKIDPFAQNAIRMFKKYVDPDRSMKVFYDKIPADLRSAPSLGDHTDSAKEKDPILLTRYPSLINLTERKQLGHVKITDIQLELAESFYTAPTPYCRVVNRNDTCRSKECKWTPTKDVDPSERFLTRGAKLKGREKFSKIQREIEMRREIENYLSFKSGTAQELSPLQRFDVHFELLDFHRSKSDKGTAKTNK